MSILISVSNKNNLRLKVIYLYPLISINLFNLKDYI